MSEDAGALKAGWLQKHVLEQLVHFGSHLPFRETDDITVILKGHLLIEEQIKAYVGRHLVQPNLIKRFTFAQFLSLARSMNRIPEFDWIFDAANMLNRVRNNISHNLTPEGLENGIEGFIAFVNKHQPDKVDTTVFEFKRPEFRTAIFAVYGALKTLNEIFNPSFEQAANPWPFLVEKMIAKSNVLQATTSAISQIASSDSSKGPSNLGSGPEPT